MGQANIFSVDITCEGVKQIDSTSISVPHNSEYRVTMTNNGLTDCDATMTLDGRRIGAWRIPSRRWIRIGSGASRSHSALSTEKGMHTLEVLFQPEKENIEHYQSLITEDNRTVILSREHIAALSEGNIDIAKTATLKLELCII